MAEQRWIAVKHNDKEYVLGFTKASVRIAETLGFSMNDIINQTKWTTSISILFYAAFLAKNPNIKENLVDEIYDGLDNKSELINQLVILYKDTIEAFMESGKNATWSFLPDKQPLK